MNDEHAKDHERERVVARETAQRLEREVEQTAQRIEQAVNIALKAVNDLATIHAEAHAREHEAHERIHKVEKQQVDDAKESMNERLAQMNEFRAALTDQSARMITREVFEAYQKERQSRLDAVIDRVIAIEKSQVTSERVDTIREEAKRRNNGVMIAIVLLALGMVANLIVNAMQAAAPMVPP